MRSRLAPAIALAIVVIIIVGVTACSGGGGASSSDHPEPSTTTTTTPDAPPSTGAAPAAGDLDRARVALTHLAPADAPTAFATRAGDPTHYIAEQSGRVLAIVGRKVAAEPVLDLTGQVAQGNEQGLLGIVFSPDGSKLYVHRSAPSGATLVDEYAFEPTPGGGGRADPRSRRRILELAQPQSNHNGGQLAFGPDGALYLGLGDGGNANDEGPGHAPQGNAQSRDTLLGKIVRIDPASRDARIFALGLRNPWRFSFDPATDDLWIGDVGQNEWEEIDRVPFADARNANFGWPLLEGTHPFRQDDAPGTVPPIFELGHADGACAVIGGYVYRGTKIPDLRGSYVFTDNCDGTIRALQVNAAGHVTTARDLGISVAGPTSFGVDADGELYVLSGSDGVFRLDPA